MDDVLEYFIIDVCLFLNRGGPLCRHYYPRNHALLFMNFNSSSLQPGLLTFIEDTMIMIGAY